MLSVSNAASRDHTAAFLLWKYKITDIDIKKLNFEFVCDLEFWLKTGRKCNHNSTIKYISNLRKIVNICLRRDWLLSDPFLGFKMTKQEVERNALTDEELQIMAGKVLSIPRLDHVRDIFLLAVIPVWPEDVKKLKDQKSAGG